LFLRRQMPLTPPDARALDDTSTRAVAMAF
jgi:hypothetical protein